LILKPDTKSTEYKHTLHNTLMKTDTTERFTAALEAEPKVRRWLPANKSR